MSATFSALGLQLPGSGKWQERASVASASFVRPGVCSAAETGTGREVSAVASHLPNVSHLAATSLEGSHSHWPVFWLRAMRQASLTQIWAFATLSAFFRSSYSLERVLWAWSPLQFSRWRR